MRSRHIVLTALVACTYAAGAASALAQSNFPDRPIRVVTSAAGGALDFLLRLIAQGLAGNAGWRVIVDNRAGGRVAAVEIMERAQPDGYTLMFIGSSLWLAPMLRDNVRYDPVQAFAPITLATSAPNVLVVHPSVTAKTVKDLIAVAKIRSGELNYASSATAGSSHLAAELFKAMAGINIVRVSYKGNGPAFNGLLAGEVQLMFANAAGVMTHVRPGRLRALAVTSGKPSQLLPELPTMAAAGVPGYEATTVYAVFAPQRTPAGIVGQLNRETVRVLHLPEIKEKFFANGVESVGGSPQELVTAMRGEMTRMGKVIRDAGIREE